MAIAAIAGMAELKVEAITLPTTNVHERDSAMSLKGDTVTEANMIIDMPQR